MDNQKQPRRVADGSRAPVPLNQPAPIPLKPGTPIPLKPGAPIPLNQGAPIPLKQAGAAPTKTASQLTLRMQNEEEQPDVAPITVRKSISWMVSAVTHFLIILILGLWTLANRPDPAIMLTISTTPEIVDAEMETLELGGTQGETTAPVLSDEPVAASMDEPPDFTTVSPTPALWTEGLPAAKKAGQVSAGNGIGLGPGYGGLGFGDKLKYLNKQGLDLVIVFDCTISMNTEITNVKTTMTKMGASLLKKLSDTRISLVGYRDENDEWTHKSIPLTNNIPSLTKFLDGVVAGGGGDEPEAVQIGMESAMQDNTFRDGAHKVMLIFGDAPPHREHIDLCVDLAKKFKAEGGHVCTITCGKRDPLESFQDIAEAGDGEAMTMQERGRIFQEILVLVFGSEHREDVVKYFDLDD